MRTAALPYLFAALVASAVMVVVQTGVLIAVDRAPLNGVALSAAQGFVSVLLINLVLAAPIWAATRFVLRRTFGDVGKLTPLALLAAGELVVLYALLSLPIALRNWTAPDAAPVGVMLLFVLMRTAPPAAMAGFAWAAVFWQAEQGRKTSGLQA